MDMKLAHKLGYIGQQLILPKFLNACLKIHLGLGGTPPLHLYYGGHPDARLRDLFGIEKEEVNPYASTTH